MKKTSSVKKGVMMEKPILFSTPMVRATLAGRKTQTRRVVKPQPCHEVIKIWKDTQDPPRYHFQAPANDCVGETISTPKYMRGDTLYVRETWQKVMVEEGEPDVYGYVYKASLETFEDYGVMKDGQEYPLLWRPSIHMPREAARIWLTVKDVRVERLQDISEDDAKSEGVLPHGDNAKPHINTFYHLWQRLNTKHQDDYSWQNNPWVWVIEYTYGQE